MPPLLFQSALFLQPRNLRTERGVNEKPCDEEESLTNLLFSSSSNALASASISSSSLITSLETYLSLLLPKSFQISLLISVGSSSGNAGRLRLFGGGEGERLSDRWRFFEDVDEESCLEECLSSGLLGLDEVEGLAFSGNRVEEDEVDTRRWDDELGRDDLGTAMDDDDLGIGFEGWPDFFCADDARAGDDDSEGKIREQPT